MIPKLLYAAWCGTKPLPEHDCYLDTWAEKLPGYEIHLLGDGDIPDSTCTKAMRSKGKIVNAAQYACWSRLYETGGIYLDLDVDILRPFDDLLEHGAFLGIENDGPGSLWAACGVLGATAGHPFIRECLDYMDGFDFSHPRVENELGPRMFTKLLRRRGWKRTDTDSTVAGVRLLNSKRFYPYSWHDTYTPECVTKDTYAVHRWAHTWNPALEEPVSIIIPCYNQAEYLAEAIDSALAQTTKPHEIIVVDDGSPEGTVEAVCKPYPSVALITQGNAGAAAARNAGIKASSGTWICCLDSDDKLHPRFIERLIGRNDIVSPMLETFGRKRPLTWPSGKVRHPTTHDYLIANQTICGSLFRKVWWEKVGGYDEAMRDGYEDWDFWTRCAHAGAGVTVYDEVLFHYRTYPKSRKHVRGSMAAANMKDSEVQAYMRAKWERLGIRERKRRPLRYPIHIAVPVTVNGITHEAGSCIDHATALEAKRLGQLIDPRIV